MAHQERDAEALRRRLYRPGASAADLAGYLRATEADRPDAAVESSPEVARVPSPRRAVAIGGAVVAAAALLGAVFLAGGPHPSKATPAAAPPTAAARGNGSRRAAFSPADVIDGGVRAGAQGSSVPEGPEMVRYVVSAGDRITAIADRFSLCQADVLDALPDGFDPPTVPAGEVLELSRSESNGC